jgi:hypothetical protein
MSGKPFLNLANKDWLTDPKLRACRPTSRSLWIDLMCFSCLDDPIGYVSLNDGPMAAADITSAIAGWTIDGVEKALADLQKNGVFSVDKRHRIYSRRIVRDEKLAAISRKNGKKGGNPSLRKTKENLSGDKPRARARVGSGSGSGKNLDSESSLELTEQEVALPGFAEPPARASIKWALAEYDALAERAGLARLRTISPERQRKLRNILNKHGAAGWTEALAAIERSNFCRGHGKEGWVIDFDFLIKPAKFVNVLEGKYDNRRTSEPVQGSWTDFLENEIMEDRKNVRTAND